jgi:hypothetical protein
MFVVVLAPLLWHQLIPSRRYAGADSAMQFPSVREYRT